MKVITSKEKITIPAFFCEGKALCTSFDTCTKGKDGYCAVVKNLDKLKDATSVQITKPIFKPIVFFSQNERPFETQFSETIKDAKKFYFMARTGVTFLSRNSQTIKTAIDNGCECKFLILNQKGSSIKYGRDEATFDKKNIALSYHYLRELKKHNPDKVKVHAFDYYPTFDFEYFEKNNEKIIVIQTHFLVSHLGPDRPMFMLKENDYWYQFFLDEFVQLWDKSQEWGEKKRIVVDGAPGSGKTSVLTGMSQRDESKKKFISLKTAGYTIFDDLIINVIDCMRKKGISDPSENWDMFFNLAVDRAIGFYEGAEPDLINFYDRGIFYLEILAQRYNCKMPKKYYDFCEKNRYDDPVFVMEPILDIDMTKPHKTDNMQKIYTKEERLAQHKQIVDLYKKHGYKVIEIAKGSNDTKESNESRLIKIKKELEI